MSKPLNDERSKKSYANELVAQTTVNGWNAPVKLYKNYYKAMALGLTGNKSTTGYYPDFTPAGKVGLIPGIKSANVSPTELVTYDHSWQVDTKKSYVSNSLGTALASMSGGTVYAPDSYNDKIDLAVYLQELETVGELKKRLSAKGVCVPIPVWGWDTADVDISNALGNTVYMPSLMKLNGVFHECSCTGDLGENQTGSITVTPKTTDEFDDWIVVKSALMYGRTNPKAGERTQIDMNPNTNLAPRPAMMGKISERGGAVAQQKTYKSGLFSVPGMQYKQKTLNTAMWQRYGMPSIGVNYNGNSTNVSNVNSANFTYGMESNFTGFPLLYGMNSHESCNAPWVSGYYNVLKNAGPISNPVLTGHLYKTTFQNVSWWTFASVIGPSAKTKDYLRECYGAQQICLLNRASTVINKSNINQYPIIGGSEDSGIYDDKALIPTSATSFSNPYYLAFPNKESLISFFADWGILATEDLLDATQGDNDTWDDEEPDPDDWGPWDPDSPGDDDWDNPTDPGIPYDPDDPGDEPLPPDISLVTSATGSTSYVLRKSEVEEVNTWLMGEDFLTDASNLFYDKMSAINSLTLFPFNVVNHDPTHCEGVTTLKIAGAVKAPQNCYLIRDGYNYWVSGGKIDFGTDFKSLRPDFMTFSGCTYTVFIPCYGNVEVDGSAVIYRSLHLDYAVDIVTGSASAVLRSYPIEGYGQKDVGYVVGIYPCQVGTVVPLVSSNTVQRQIAIIQGIASGAQGGSVNGNNAGRSVPVSRTSGVSPSGFKEVKNAPSPGATSAALGVAGAVVGAAAGAVMGGIESAMSNPLAYSHIGTVGPMSAWATGFKAQLTVTATIPAYPANYEYLMGQMTSQHGYLYKFAQNGLNYVQCEVARLNVPDATQLEKSLIESALMEGVYV